MRVWFWLGLKVFWIFLWVFLLVLALLVWKLVATFLFHVARTFLSVMETLYLFVCLFPSWRHVIVAFVPGTVVVKRCFSPLPWDMTRSWRCSVSITLYVFCVCLCLILCFLCYSVTCTVFFMLHVCGFMCVWCFCLLQSVFSVWMTESVSMSVSLTVCSSSVWVTLCVGMSVSDSMCIFCLSDSLYGHVCLSNTVTVCAFSVWLTVCVDMSDSVSGMGVSVLCLCTLPFPLNCFCLADCWYQLDKEESWGAGHVCSLQEPPLWPHKVFYCQFTWLPTVLEMYFIMINHPADVN